MKLNLPIFKIRSCVKYLFVMFVRGELSQVDRETTTSDDASNIL